MKTYRNEPCGFEIDIPEGWSFHSDTVVHRTSGKDHSLLFICRPDESFNIQVGPYIPEFSLASTEGLFEKYATEKGYTSLALGRIFVEGQEHVWTRYYMGGDLWAKKYIIVLNEIEYSITASCSNQRALLEMEEEWDAVVRSFRLMPHPHANIKDTFKIKEGEKDELHEARVDAAGPLYAQAYKAVESGQYLEARTLLEKCIAENNNNELAHKELAVVLKKLGDLEGALFHRREVKRINPWDVINRHNLVTVLVALGLQDEALQEATEIIEQLPGDPHLYKRLAELLGIYIPFPTDGSPISPGLMEKAYNAYASFEIGKKHFDHGRYQEALKQFEEGKSLATDLPSNYFGASTTIMQMIEKNILPEHEILNYLERAEKNIDECLKILPTNSDYMLVKNEIIKYKRKREG